MGVRRALALAAVAVLAVAGMLGWLSQGARCSAASVPGSHAGGAEAVGGAEEPSRRQLDHLDETVEVTDADSPLSNYQLASFPITNSDDQAAFGFSNTPFNWDASSYRPPINHNRPGYDNIACFTFASNHPYGAQMDSISVDPVNGTVAVSVTCYLATRLARIPVVGGTNDMIEGAVMLYSYNSATQRLESPQLVLPAFDRHVRRPGLPTRTQVAVRNNTLVVYHRPSCGTDPGVLALYIYEKQPGGSWSLAHGGVGSNSVEGLTGHKLDVADTYCDASRPLQGLQVYAAADGSNVRVVLGIPGHTRNVGRVVLLAKGGGGQWDHAAGSPKIGTASAYGHSLHMSSKWLLIGDKDTIRVYAVNATAAPSQTVTRSLQYNCPTLAEGGLLFSYDDSKDATLGGAGKIRVWSSCGCNSGATCDTSSPAGNNGLGTFTQLVLWEISDGTSAARWDAAPSAGLVAPENWCSVGKKATTTITRCRTLYVPGSRTAYLGCPEDNQLTSPEFPQAGEVVVVGLTASGTSPGVSCAPRELVTTVKPEPLGAVGRALQPAPAANGIVVGARNYLSLLTPSATTRVSTLTGNGTMTALQTIVPPSAASGEAFGEAVVSTGVVLAIADPNNNGRRGAVYIYRRLATAAATPYRTSPDATITFRTGTSRCGAVLALITTATGGQRMAVTCPSTQCNSAGQNCQGAVFVVDGSSDGRTWSSPVEITRPAALSTTSTFGSDVHLAVDKLAVGVDAQTQAKHLVYVYQRSATGTWSEFGAPLEFPNPARMRGTWVGLATDGNKLAVGVPGMPYAGLSPAQFPEIILPCRHLCSPVDLSTNPRGGVMLYELQNGVYNLTTALHHGSCTTTVGCGVSVDGAGAAFTVAARTCTRLGFSSTPSVTSAQPRLHVWRPSTALAARCSSRWKGADLPVLQTANALITGENRLRTSLYGASLISGDDVFWSEALETYANRIQAGTVGAYKIAGNGVPLRFESGRQAEPSPNRFAWFGSGIAYDTNGQLLAVGAANASTSTTALGGGRVHVFRYVPQVLTWPVSSAAPARTVTGGVALQPTAVTTSSVDSQLGAAVYVGVARAIVSRQYVADASGLRFLAFDVYRNDTAAARAAASGWAYMETVEHVDEVGCSFLRACIATNTLALTLSCRSTAQGGFTGRKMIVYRRGATGTWVSTTADAGGRNVDLGYTKLSDTYGDNVACVSDDLVATVSRPCVESSTVGLRRGLQQAATTCAELYGRLYLYFYNSASGRYENLWTQQSPVSIDGFGTSMAVWRRGGDDNWIVVGAPYSSNISPFLRHGVAYVYNVKKVLGGILLELTATVNPPDPRNAGYFGASVAIDASQMVIGEPGKREFVAAANAGKIHLLLYPELQTGTVKPHTTVAGNPTADGRQYGVFGAAVAVFQSHVAVLSYAERVKTARRSSSSAASSRKLAQATTPAATAAAAATAAGQINFFVRTANTAALTHVPSATIDLAHTFPAFFTEVKIPVSLQGATDRALVGDSAAPLSVSDSFWSSRSGSVGTAQFVKVAANPSLPPATAQFVPPPPTNPPAATPAPAVTAAPPTTPAPPPTTTPGPTTTGAPLSQEQRRPGVWVTRPLCSRPELWEDAQFFIEPVRCWTLNFDVGSVTFSQGFAPACRSKVLPLRANCTIRVTSATVLPVDIGATNVVVRGPGGGDFSELGVTTSSIRTVEPQLAYEIDLFTGTAWEGDVTIEVTPGKVPVRTGATRMSNTLTLSKDTVNPVLDIVLPGFSIFSADTYTFLLDYGEPIAAIGTKLLELFSLTNALPVNVGYLPEDGVVSVEIRPVEAGDITITGFGGTTDLFNNTCQEVVKTIRYSPQAIAEGTITTTATTVAAGLVGGAMAGAVVGAAASAASAPAGAAPSGAAGAGGVMTFGMFLQRQDYLNNVQVDDSLGSSKAMTSSTGFSTLNVAGPWEGPLSLGGSGSSSTNETFEATVGRRLSSVLDAPAALRRGAGGPERRRMPFRALRARGRGAQGFAVVDARVLQAGNATATTPPAATSPPEATTDAVLEANEAAFPILPSPWDMVIRRGFWLLIILVALTVLQISLQLALHAFGRRMVKILRFPRPQLHLFVFLAPVVVDTAARLIDGGNGGEVFIGIVAIVLIPGTVVLCSIWIVLATQVRRDSFERLVYYQVSEIDAKRFDFKLQYGDSWFTTILRFIGIARRHPEGEWVYAGPRGEVLLGTWGPLIEEFSGPIVVRRGATFDLDPDIHKFDRGYLEHYRPPPVRFLPWNWRTYKPKPIAHEDEEAFEGSEKGTRSGDGGRTSSFTASEGGAMPARDAYGATSDVDAGDIGVATPGKRGMRYGGEFGERRGPDDLDDMSDPEVDAGGELYLGGAADGAGTRRPAARTRGPEPQTFMDVEHGRNDAGAGPSNPPARGPRRGIGSRQPDGPGGFGEGQEDLKYYTNQLAYDDADAASQQSMDDAAVRSLGNFSATPGDTESTGFTTIEDEEDLRARARMTAMMYVRASTNVTRTAVVGLFAFVANFRGLTPVVQAVLLAILGLVNIVYLVALDPYAADIDRISDWIGGASEMGLYVSTAALVLGVEVRSDPKERLDYAEKCGFAVLIFMAIAWGSYIICMLLEIYTVACDTWDGLIKPLCCPCLDRARLDDVVDDVTREIREEVLMKKYANRWLCYVFDEPLQGWPRLSPLTAAERKVLRHKVMRKRAAALGMTMAELKDYLKRRHGVHRKEAREARRMAKAIAKVEAKQEKKLVKMGTFRDKFTALASKLKRAEMETEGLQAATFTDEADAGRNDRERL
ncbi:unnamed protein product [Pedinophyceae sp. YPF-701]|nr:unnamed protein product [Pedinophyceae sp. YPF-701]